ncbi:hypothetical protein CRG98_015604 [Punica granatum]|uniref:Uncharacterized protein n=1 Tax=Punica granatum TaxID=22663 RepID=A0A2I0K613_PUNGR|nr:hypothetical protein CRG98_015604 [Punica granatum]
MGPTAQPSQATKPQSLSKNLSSSSPLPHFRSALAKAETGQSHRKTVWYSGLVFPFEASIIVFWPYEGSGPKDASRVQPRLNDVPFPPTTLPSSATMFKGFLTTLTLPREEVVTVTCYTGSNAPNHRTRGPTPPNSPSACNPSAEWDLASIHRHTPNMAYVEGNLDWVRERGLDITRELDRSKGYSGNQPIHLQTIGSIGSDHRLLELA